ncbi:MAG: hypothetical protein PHT13_00205 [Methanosarcina sp.]|nr:hypothetical protein [Methanosarcina sp.]
MGFDIMSNIFTGSSYEPLTVVASAPVNEDMGQILDDLTTHLAILRVAFNKLDTISSGATGDLTASELVARMNTSTVRIDENNIFLNPGTLVGISSAVSNHLLESHYVDKHPLVKIQGLTTVYSTTPSAFNTSASRTMLDEINNIRYQIYRIIGKSTWVSTPTNSLNSLNTLFNNFSPHTIQCNVRLVTSNTSLTASDCIIYIDTSATALNLYLPSLADVSLQGLTYHLIMPSSSGRKCTLVRGVDPDRIDMSSTIDIFAYDNIMLIADCVQRKWWIVGDYDN